MAKLNDFKEYGELIVISSPSGGGKTSLIKKLLLIDSKEAYEEHKKLLPTILSPSYTTRGQRPNEKEGKNYYFIDREKFVQMIKNGDFLEYAEVFENFYGTSKSWVEEHLKIYDVILELDWQGAYQVKEKYPDAKTIFILPPSYEDLKLRLNERGLDRKDIIEKRLAEAKKEVEKGKSFDHLIVNDDFAMALKDLKSIIFKNNKLPDIRKTLAQDHLKRLLED